MKIFKVLTAAVLMFISVNGYPRTLIDRFMPENDLYLEDNLFNANMTEDTFNAILDNIKTYYEPIIQGHGATLVIERNWSDSTVNAYAYQEGTSWYIAMFGGMARRAEITEDGFAMVACHELGHHLAGFPFYPDGNEWAANEGQSDYFATLACARKIWPATERAEMEKNGIKCASELPSNRVLADTVDPVAKEKCDSVYTDLCLTDKYDCYRAAMAGYSLGNLLAVLGKTKVSFSTPDKKVVTKTSNSHPAAQCRLDTYFAGALCNMSWQDSLIPADEKESTKVNCAKGSVAQRPLCWFKPTI
ncbi:MAG: M48 family metalloprotease [Oligoflexales bacterium]|nr:M48 family metalloprotease [Oligoflexales bacterium]